MVCGSCGAQVAAGSRFCNICGSTVAAPAVATLQHGSRGLEVPEHVVFSLRPAFLFVGVQYAVAAAVWLAAAALIAVVVSMLDLPASAGAVAVVAAGLLAFVKPVLAHVRRQRQLYTLTSHKLEIQRGIIATTVRNIPLSKVQDVTVTSSIAGRLLGLGDIIIDNASDAEGRLVIKGVREPKRYADILLGELRRWN